MNINSTLQIDFWGRNVCLKLWLPMYYMMGNSGSFLHKQYYDKNLDEKTYTNYKIPQNHDRCKEKSCSKLAKVSIDQIWGKSIRLGVRHEGKIMAIPM